MKRTIKAITVALAVMLLACSVFAFGASANTEEESGAVKILAQNLYYDDLVSVLYAVDVPLENAENVTVQYYYASNPDVKHEAVLLDTTNPNYVCTKTLENGTEVKYPCFRTDGFAAHNFTDKVYAIAYIGDTAPANPVYKEYSVAEYLHSRLYKDDFINKTEADGDDYTRKMHYENLMAYGETAQMLFDKEETLITDYCYLWTTDKGIKINGAASALVAPNTTVTLAGADSYTATKVGGEPTDITASYTAEAGVIAKIAAKTVMDFENAITSDYVHSYAIDASGNRVSVNDISDPASNNMKFTLVNIGTDEAVNNVLCATAAVANGKSGVTKVQIAEEEEGASGCYTFEMKMNIVVRQKDKNVARIRFVNNSSGDALNLYIGSYNAKFDDTTTSNALKIATTGSNCSLGAGKVLFNAGESENIEGKLIPRETWFNIRIEFYFAGAANGAASEENTYMKLYVDEILAFDGLASWAIGANIKCAEIEHLSTYAGAQSYYDDISFTRTDKAYAPGNEYAE